MMMFFKLPKVKRFEYKPRYYKPESEEEEEGPRIKFRHLTRRRPTPKRSIWLLIVLIIVIIFLIRFFISFTKKNDQQFKIEDIKIEMLK
jgi:hypothetical protein